MVVTRQPAGKDEHTGNPDPPDTLSSVVSTTPEKSLRCPNGHRPLDSVTMESFEPTKRRNGMKRILVFLAFVLSAWQSGGINPAFSAHNHRSVPNG